VAQATGGGEIVEPSRTVAVIDVGSNSVRLLVARQLSPVAFEVRDEARFDARLGEGQSGGDLTAEGRERGLRALRIVAQVARSHRPDSLVVVGTEALRRAPNAAAFIAEAREQTGLDVRVLSGQEEALAGFLGVVNSTGLTDGYLLDIGGGSLELMEVVGRELRSVQSAPLGAIYARELYFRSDPPSSRDIRALRKAVREQFRLGAALPGFHGTGGAVRNLARIVRLQQRYPLRRLHGFVIERRQLHRLATRLASLSPEQRRGFPGLSQARADTLPAAAIVVDELMELAGATMLTVAGQGLREGLAWQELRPQSPILPAVRDASISGLALANGIDEHAARPVAEAAARIFNTTANLHRLSEADLDLLTSGARLAAIGMHVDYYNRDRHAEYLVHSGDLHGFTHREIVMIAALVRCASSGSPDLSAYRGIVQADDTGRVTVLAAILGAAQAVYRRNPSPVRSFSAALGGAGLQFELRAEGEVDAELYELERQQKRLEGALKVQLRVEVVR
jgi:exopolyphosphatase/guanosine-5'-triphosphate,3'-diphosphate pyrophosphatase